MLVQSSNCFQDCFSLSASTSRIVAYTETVFFELTLYCAYGAHSGLLVSPLLPALLLLPHADTRTASAVTPASAYARRRLERTAMVLPPWAQTRPGRTGSPAYRCVLCHPHVSVCKVICRAFLGV